MSLLITGSDALCDYLKFPAGKVAKEKTHMSKCLTAVFWFPTCVGNHDLATP